jgi:DNA-directed RNA polymerase subunit RPC12/RpoP
MSKATNTLKCRECEYTFDVKPEQQREIECPSCKSKQVSEVEEAKKD